MKKEFNLSEKMVEDIIQGKSYPYYPEEDIKEFIKNLKEWIEKEMVFYTEENKQYEDETKEDLIYFIDKLAGDKLK